MHATGIMVHQERKAYISAVLLISIAIGGAGVGATDITLQGSTYILDSAGFINTTSLTVGQPTVLDLLATDQATNATIGNILGYFVPLRPTGPFQVQYTVQLASGTLQARTKHSSSATPAGATQAHLTEAQ